MFLGNLPTVTNIFFFFDTPTNAFTSALKLLMDQILICEIWTKLSQMGSKYEDGLDRNRT